MTLSVVIPVYNAVLSLQKTLQSVANSTDHLSELILVDDASDGATRGFINGLTLDPKLNCRLTKTYNPVHSWTNPSWNIGVKFAQSDYIAVLNSDITLSPHWDSDLISLLDKKHCSIACPMTVTLKGNRTLDPLLEAIDPQMINGACFMFRRQETKKLFPIPDCLTHWTGDNYLADQAKKVRGTAFSASAAISHAVSQSSNRIDRKTYLDTVMGDIVAYEGISGRDMSLIKDEITKQMRAASRKMSSSFA